MENKDRSAYSGRIGLLIVSITGFIFHFLYNFSGKNPVVGAFTPVNESIWEHLKLLFFPYVIYMTAEFIIFGKNIRGFLFARIIGLLAGLIFIPTAFYTYTGITGSDFLIADIIIYFLAVYISFMSSEKRLSKGFEKNSPKTIPAVIIILCLTILFIGFTFYTPDAPIFISPV